MKTVKQLGALVKLEHQGKYQGYSDEEVGRATKLQYPGKYDDFLDNSLETYNQNPLITQVEELVKYYNPDRGKLSARWQRGKSEARAKLQTVLSAEQMVVLEQAAQFEQAVINGKMRIAEYNSFIALHHFQLGQLKVQATLISQALEEGYTADNWQEVKRERESFTQEINKSTHSTDQQIRVMKTQSEIQIEWLGKELFKELSLLDKQSDREIRLLEIGSQLKLHEFREMEAIKFNNDVNSWREKTRLALIAKAMVNHQKKMLVQELIDNMYVQIEEIQQGRLSEGTKCLMIEDRKAIITSFKVYRDELQLV